MSAKTCHLIERRAVRKIATFIWRNIQPLNGYPKGVEVGQEEVGVVHEDLVIQVLWVAQAEEKWARQETVEVCLYKIFKKF